MDYFNDLVFGIGDHVPDCHAWIDRKFPNQFALNFAYAGRIRLRSLKGNSAVLSAPVAWWTWPGPKFVYGAVANAGWHHYYITFHGSRAQRMFVQGLLPMETSGAWRRVGNPTWYAREFDDLLVAVRGGQQARAVRILEEMCLHLHETAAGADSSRQEQLHTLAERIRQRPAVALDCTAEARRLHMSLGHFGRLFRGITGVSPYQYVLRSRMEEAARQLRQTDYPIKRIGASVGYDDIYHFSKVFKRHLQLPPGAYRREARLLSGAIAPK